jgi:hypothetical protein
MCVLDYQNGFLFEYLLFLIGNMCRFLSDY